MDYDVDIKFQKVLEKLEEKFGAGMDIQAILFLIGVNELGIGYKEFSKSEKTDLIHIAICSLLMPYKYYEFKGRDEDHWPHFELINELPPLTDREQQHLMKEAIIEYFKQNGYFDVNAATT